MGNKSRPELVLSLLLMAAVGLEAFVSYTVHSPAVNLTWAEARLYCQEKYLDLVALNTIDRDLVTELLTTADMEQMWIGLLRDPENDAVWKWISQKTENGMTRDDVSQGGSWARGQQSRHCAVVSDKDLKWYSDKCSNKYGFYCSVGDKFHYHPIAVSWHNASGFCQKSSGRLATITQTNRADLNQTGWIGLYRVAGETWSWIGNFPSDYRNWAPGEPLNADCAAIDSVTGKYHSNPCSKKLRFLCYNDNLVVVKEKKTWEDALKHCQAMKMPCAGPCLYEHYFLSLESPISNYSYNYLKDKIKTAMTDEVWIGLRFLGGEWWWVSGQTLDAKGRPPKCPSQSKHCGTLSKHDTNGWITRDCSEKRNFVCHRVKYFAKIIT